MSGAGAPRHAGYFMKTCGQVGRGEHEGLPFMEIKQLISCKVSVIMARA
jgi:hypothetical protein